MRRYWTADMSPLNPTLRDEDHLATLRDLVSDATRLRLHADVPVGIALSGGLDSSILAAVAAEAQAENGVAAALLSVVHPGAADDESEFVHAMASHLGSDVTLVSLDMASDGPDATYDLIKRCNHMNDGPLSSLSSVLFYKLMEQARARNITAILTGQGADEAFCGYRKFPFLEAKSRLKSGRILSGTGFLANFISNGTMLGQFKFSEAKRYLGAKNASILGPAAKEAYAPIDLSEIGGGIANRQLLDIERLSVPYLCHYEDRMSMAMSREVRSPFLDYRVLEMGLKLPVHLKMQRGWTKYALRKAFEDKLPASISWRKDKKGFVNPEADWFKGELRARVLDLMGDPANPVYQLGLVDRATYLDLYTSFCNGDNRIWFRDVFAPFSLSLWLADWKSRAN
ncbi:asparagine synthase C-terminal domain-containing protein [Gymnodinialimonas phycosphaerae]|uniref:asparagine synthetase B family protein n=1 Tax=Gymnodinialimonas phycosphaerae TaxID=2841589 RepID=UPI0031F38B38